MQIYCLTSHSEAAINIKLGKLGHEISAHIFEEKNLARPYVHVIFPKLEVSCKCLIHLVSCVHFFVSFIPSNFLPLYCCWFSFLTSTSVCLITTCWNFLVSNPDCTGLKPPLHLGPQFICLVIFYFFGLFQHTCHQYKKQSVYMMINLLDRVRILESGSHLIAEKNIEKTLQVDLCPIYNLSFLILFASKTQ